MQLLDAMSVGAGLSAVTTATHWVSDNSPGVEAERLLARRFFVSTTTTRATFAILTEGRGQGGYGDSICLKASGGPHDLR